MECEFFVNLYRESTEIAILSRHLYRGVSDEIARFARELSESEIIPFEPVRVMPGRKVRGEILMCQACTPECLH
jgi:hypothetical protein